MSNFHDFTINDINGNSIALSSFKGKPVLLVNVASECGFTPQYADLQALHEQHGDKVTVIGVPSNNFGGQEPGSHQQIKTFCERNFGVTFTLTEKVDVIGKNQHPLYRWLSREEENGKVNQEPNWNFCKYMINADGEVISFYTSAVNPFDDNILNHLN